jgi:enoyl-CoA hydratase
MSGVRVEDRSEGVRVLTLDRPPANAIDERLLEDLITCLDEARDHDGVRSVVLAGAGRFFRGGFDLAAPARDAAATRALNDLYRASHRTLVAFPKPTVAMVQGHAIAGGLVLALACDRRLALDGDYRVGMNEVAIGASFPRIAFEIVRLRLSHVTAVEMLLGAGLYAARDALRLGVFDAVFPRDALEGEALRQAGRLGAFPRAAYAHTKAALIAELVQHVDAETALEAERTAAVWTSEESRAARAAQRRKLGLRRG